MGQSLGVGTVGQSANCLKFCCSCRRLAVLRSVPAENRLGHCPTGTASLHGTLGTVGTRGTAGTLTRRHPTCERRRISKVLFGRQYLELTCLADAARSASQDHRPI